MCSNFSGKTIDKRVFAMYNALSCQEQLFRNGCLEKLQWEGNAMRCLKSKKTPVNRFVILFFLLVLLIIIVYGGICVAHADGLRGRQDRQKLFTSIEIQYGDTLWTIAERYKNSDCQSTEEYVCELMQMNHLKDDRIVAGNYLMISYYNETLPTEDTEPEPLPVAGPVIQWQSASD